jgi:hypothetical protein
MCVYIICIISVEADAEGVDLGVGARQVVPPSIYYNVSTSFGPSHNLSYCLYMYYTLCLYIIITSYYSIYLSINLFIYLSIYLSISISTIYLFICLPLYIHAGHHVQADAEGGDLGVGARRVATLFIHYNVSTSILPSHKLSYCLYMYHVLCHDIVTIITQ